MMRFSRRQLLLGLAGFARAQTPSDWRNIATGFEIPDEGYCDQPYIVRTQDGHWLCVLTTGQGVEGERGQHIVATRSRDQGRTWSPLIDIEPASGPEASWVMPLLAPSGRVYVFYTYNNKDLRQVNSNSSNTARRVDTVGAYMFKYSADDGRTWSRERFEIPMRKMRIDRENTHSGDVLFFWGVGKPVILRDGSAMFGFAKVGRWGQPGTMIESQGCFLRSPNLLTEKDPRRIRWELLPEGDEGLRAPKGPVSDEANLVELSDGALYATYRTIDGYNCHAYSRDGGRTWTPPAYATYTPGGRRIKHPRAANFVRKFSNGKFLLWFHNHGGEAAITSGNWEYYRARNPAWISGGVERDGHIHWSEPEILLYDDNPDVRISYPDFVEDRGRFFVTETQKTVARVHEMDRSLLEGVWNPPAGPAAGGIAVADRMPDLPNLAGRGGFSLDFDLRLRELTAGQILLDTRGDRDAGLLLETGSRFNLRLTLSDGTRKSSWESDGGTHPGTLRVNAWQHVTITVDAGPRIISYVIDGVLNDGGAARQYGWGRFDPALADVNGRPNPTVAPKLFGELRNLRLYKRPLRTFEAVGNFRAELTR
ncbi:MAG: exo-alpha-sialidase [Bryobacterales bacterium]|nr:exo-alpha-sialidase [Bryobacterales bacterium]